MNRREYIERLEQLLLVLPQEEREEALQYYNDYLDDAGVENEADVIRELGSPEEVAAKIRAGFAGGYAEYSEQGYEDARFQNAQEIAPSYREDNAEWKNSVYEAQMEEEAKGKKVKKNDTNIWKIIAIVLIVLIAGPIVLPLGIALLAVVIAVIIAILAVVAAIGISGFAIAFAGVVVAGAGIAKVILVPSVGILAVGVGCILLAVGVVISWLMIGLAVKVLPGMVRGIVNVLGRPFRKAGGN